MSRSAGDRLSEPLNRFVTTRGQRDERERIRLTERFLRGLEVRSAQREAASRAASLRRVSDAVIRRPPLPENVFVDGGFYVPRNIIRFVEAVFEANIGPILLNKLVSDGDLFVVQLGGTRIVGMAPRNLSQYESWAAAHPRA